MNDKQKQSHKVNNVQIWLDLQENMTANDETKIASICRQLENNHKKFQITNAYELKYYQICFYNASITGRINVLKVLHKVYVDESDYATTATCHATKILQVETVKFLLENGYCLNNKTSKFKRIQSNDLQKLVGFCCYNIFPNITIDNEDNIYYLKRIELFTIILNYAFKSSDIKTVIYILHALIRKKNMLKVFMFVIKLIEKQKISISSTSCTTNVIMYFPLEKNITCGIWKDYLIEVTDTAIHSQSREITEYLLPIVKINTKNIIIKSLKYDWYQIIVSLLPYSNDLTMITPEFVRTYISGQKNFHQALYLFNRNVKQKDLIGFDQKIYQECIVAIRNELNYVLDVLVTMIIEYI